MRYKLLGRSGLRVSEIALGTMTFGEQWGFGANAEECRRIFDTYVKAGGNFIDTANKYTEGESERMVGDFVRSDRDRFVVATKYTLSTNYDDPNASGNHRKNMVQSVEQSLKRLDLETIDLYWVHAWDFTTGIDEVMRALDDLVRAGKVLYIGISDAPAWVASSANTMADLRGWTPFVGLQVEYSLIERTVERDLIPMAEAFDLGVCAWAPLAGGVLTGKYTRNPTDIDTLRAQSNERRLSERGLRIAATVDAVADELGRSSVEVAINWTRQRNPRVFPIIGARRESQVAGSLKCLEFEIPEELMIRLDEASAISLGFPHDFLKMDRINQVVRGNHQVRRV